MGFENERVTRAIHAFDELLRYCTKVVLKSARAASVNWTIFSSRFSENVSTVMLALIGPLMPITLVPAACP